MSATKFFYGMRLRGFSIGCQPKEGFVERIDPPMKWRNYWDIIIYDRRLTEEECKHYSLDLLDSKSTC